MKKILVIDDDPAFRDIIKAGLETAHYEVSLAASGEVGLQKISKSIPDAILLDIKMPGMNGLEFLTEINKKFGEGKIPIIITSNLSSMDTISDGIALGIRGYILKSNESIQGILESVERFLK